MTTTMMIMRKKKQNYLYSIWRISEIGVRKGIKKVSTGLMKRNLEKAKIKLESYINYYWTFIN